MSLLLKQFPQVSLAPPLQRGASPATLRAKCASKLRPKAAQARVCNSEPGRWTKKVLQQALPARGGKTLV